MLMRTLLPDVQTRRRHFFRHFYFIQYKHSVNITCLTIISLYLHLLTVVWKNFNVNFGRLRRRLMFGKYILKHDVLPDRNQSATKALSLDRRRG